MRDRGKKDFSYGLVFEYCMGWLGREVWEVGGFFGGLGFWIVED